jgi:hypothetical protein
MYCSQGAAQGTTSLGLMGYFIQIFISRNKFVAEGAQSGFLSQKALVMAHGRVDGINVKPNCKRFSLI